MNGYSFTGLEMINGTGSHDGRFRHVSWEEDSRRLKVRQAEKMQRSIEHANAAARDLSWSRFYKQAWFWCSVALLMWLIGGVSWYMVWFKWPFFTSIYYLVQATMSIGFGYPTEEQVCSVKEFQSSGAARYVGGDHTYKTPQEGGRGGCTAADISKGVTSLMVLYFAAIAAASLGVILAKLSNPTGYWYKQMTRVARLEKLRKKAEETPSWTDDIVIKMQIFWMNNVWLKAVLALNSWIAIGVIFGMIGPQKMSFLTAYYFAVTSISTAGLEAPRPMEWPSKDCVGECKNMAVDPNSFITDAKHQYQFGFVGLYCLIGVPLFGWSVSAIGSVFADIVSMRDSDVTLYRAFGEEEFELMRMLGEGPTGMGHQQKAITLQKFVECQLLRMGKVTYDELFMIKERFMELDLDASGLIDFSELRATGGTGKHITEDKISPEAMKAALEYCQGKNEALWSDYVLTQKLNQNKAPEGGKRTGYWHREHNPQSHEHGAAGNGASGELCARCGTLLTSNVMHYGAPEVPHPWQREERALPSLYNRNVPNYGLQKEAIFVPQPAQHDHSPFSVLDIPSYDVQEKSLFARPKVRDKRGDAFAHAQVGFRTTPVQTPYHGATHSAGMSHEVDGGIYAESQFADMQWRPQKIVKAGPQMFGRTLQGDEEAMAMASLQPIVPPEAHRWKSPDHEVYISTPQLTPRNQRRDQQVDRTSISGLDPLQARVTRSIPLDIVSSEPPKTPEPPPRLVVPISNAFQAVEDISSQPQYSTVSVTLPPPQSSSTRPLPNPPQDAVIF